MISKPEPSPRGWWYSITERGIAGGFQHIQPVQEPHQEYSHPMIIPVSPHPPGKAPQGSFLRPGPNNDLVKPAIDPARQTI